MIWFGVFFTLLVGSVLCTVLFVPSEHIRNYARCRKDAAYYAATLFSNAIWVVALVQHVVNPDPFTLWLKLTGIGFYVLGQVLIISARRVNNMFVPAIIYIPPSWRVTRWPYSFCDHPGYFGFNLSAMGAACMLGGWWVLFPLALYVFLIVRRTKQEDRILSGEVSL